LATLPPLAFYGGPVRAWNASTRLVGIGDNLQMRMAIDGGLNFTARFRCTD
jgi:hypothetical protein